MKCVCGWSVLFIYEIIASEMLRAGLPAENQANTSAVLVVTGSQNERSKMAVEQREDGPADGYKRLHSDQGP